MQHRRCIRSKGDLENALLQHQKALEVFLPCMARSRTWPCADNIGSVRVDMGKHEAALVQYQKALEIRTRVFGSEHLDVAKSVLT